MNGWQALANGIVEQAVKDYRAALKTLRSIRIPKRRWLPPWRWSDSSTLTGTAS